MRVYKWNGKYYALISNGTCIDPLFQIHTPSPEEKEVAEKGKLVDTWKDYVLYTDSNLLIDYDADYVWITPEGAVLMALPDKKRSAVLICVSLYGGTLNQKPDSAYSHMKHVLKCIYVSVDMAPDAFPAPKTLAQKEALDRWAARHKIELSE